MAQRKNWSREDRKWLDADDDYMRIEKRIRRMSSRYNP